jgi:Ni/Fe-hydrogenase subunit HybB-like protein
MAARGQIIDDVAPVLASGETYASVTERVSGIVLTRHTPRWWLLGFAVAFLGLQIFLVAAAYLVTTGVGIWGVMIPVGWGWAIINFVWWIGIGHAGTLISAILLLFRQDWRTSINRFAEAMTLFAVSCAGVFPILHMGRPWLAYWLTPYPNSMSLWPQFRSPLVWDVFAVTTYATVSALFWYIGLLPDLATLRDRAQGRLTQIVYGILALGWRGSAKHWHRYETAYLLLAGLATPLVISVHTVVSFDFAVSIVPGWHTTVFPPYFVAGAIFAGFAMVITLMVPLRKLYHLETLITERHLQNMAKVMLATGLIVVYGYATEAFMAWYSGSQYEGFMMLNRMTGPYSPYYWSLIFCNAAVPQLLWLKRVRTTPWMLFVVAMFVNWGMWLERYIIVVTSLHRDYLPSSWGMYSGTIWDLAMFVGTLGLFGVAMLLFVRVLPMISISEVRLLVKQPLATVKGGRRD